MSGVIGDSDRVNRQRRWDERYSGTEFQVPAKPSDFVAAELAMAIDTLVRAERTSSGR